VICEITGRASLHCPRVGNRFNTFLWKLVARLYLGSELVAAEGARVINPRVLGEALGTHLVATAERHVSVHLLGADKARVLSQRLLGRSRVAKLRLELIYPVVPSLDRIILLVQLFHELLDGALVRPANGRLVLASPRVRMGNVRIA